MTMVVVIVAAYRRTHSPSGVVYRYSSKEPTELYGSGYI